MDRADGPADGLSSGPKGTDVTLAVDHAGRERFRINGPVVSAVAEGDGWVLLMPGDMRRIRPDGSVVWSTPINWGGPLGQLVRCPDGEIIGLTHNGGGEVYQVARLGAAAGSVRWRYTSPDRSGNHFIYVLEAGMELRRGLLGITQDGTDGMYVTILDARTGEQMLGVSK